VVVILVALFAVRDPLDGMHQKRMFVLHTEKVGGLFLLVVVVVVVGADFLFLFRWWIGYDV
jgi:hypothetical protein